MSKRTNCVICNIPLPFGSDGVKCLKCREATVIGQQEKGYDRRQGVSCERTEHTPHTIKYGLSVEQQKILKGKQEFRCALCNKKRYLVLDHDHDTGKARGYLCRGCNTKLSGFDDVEFVHKATAYLQSPPANNT